MTSMKVLQSVAGFVADLKRCFAPLFSASKRLGPFVGSFRPLNAVNSNLLTISVR